MLPVKRLMVIPEGYKDTPIGSLLEYHNLGKEAEVYEQAQLLICTCMDNRINLRIPKKFAYIIRTGGANLKFAGFKISYAIAVGGVRHIAIIGHTMCGMSGLESKKEQFVKGLVSDAGWCEQEAEKHFRENQEFFEIGDEIDFIQKETDRLRKIYPKIKIIPLMYRVEDNLLYMIK